MITYVVLANFTDQGIRSAKDSPKRADAFKKMAATFGVTVKELFWTQGRYDVVTILDAPDEFSVTALNLSLSALGNVRTESLRSFLGGGHDEYCWQDAVTALRPAFENFGRADLGAAGHGKKKTEGGPACMVRCSADGAAATR